ncbi:MAG: type II CAAX endopeptidase family protein [Clostridia bacterium]
MKKDKRFFITLIYFLSMLTIIVIRAMFAFGIFGKLSYIQHDMTFSLLVQVFAMGIFPATLYIMFLKKNKVKKPIKSMLDDFGYSRGISLKSWLMVFVISIISPYVIVGISSVWQSLLYFLGYNPGVASGGNISTVSMLLYELAFTAIMPAIFEEFTNRGLLYRAYNDTKKRYSVVLITSLMFALMHSNITQVGYTFVCGLIAGTLVLHTKSIYPAVFYHFTNNAVSVLRDYGEGTGNFLNVINKFYDWIFYKVSGNIVGNVLFFGAIIVIIWLLLELGVENSNRPVSRRKKKVEPQFEMLPSADKTKIAICYKPIDNMFLYSTIVLMSLVTIYTLIWGILR